MNNIAKWLLSAGVLASATMACQPNQEKKEASVAKEVATAFQVKADRFADLQILRYQVPGFDQLDAKDKEFLYYMSQAALSGRDIIWDQNYKYNLTVRRTIEAIVDTYKGDRSAKDFADFMVYAKRVWFSNGIHHHYSNNKILPKFSSDFLATLIEGADKAKLPLAEGQSVKDFVKFISPIITDASVAPKKVSLDPDKDLLKASANNLYENVSQAEAEAYYESIKDKSTHHPVMYGLNSKVIKENGKVIEKVYKVGGMYSDAIEKIVYWLEKAKGVSQDAQQQKTLGLLIDYYKTGDLKKFDEYCIEWVKDTNTNYDAINGFIEVYGDAMGYKGAFESVVQMKDLEASARLESVAKEAQWFEDHSPIMDEHKKKNVKGVSYKVVTVVIEGGDATPSTPIGINLPNSNWIRAEHGSKSVSLGNIKDAYNAASGGSTLKEFCFTDEEVARAKKHGVLSGKLHTALHEVIGHASGKLNKGIGTPKETLKSYASAIEEGRADLVGLYFIMDQKLVDMGIMPSLDVAKAQYEGYIRNGMMLQLRRLEPGEIIEEAHMRNRALVARWCYEKGQKENVIEKVVKDGKTFFVIRDYEKLRGLFGDLLRELQRIKSEGDYDEARRLMETYGVKVDPELHKEVVSRYAQFDSAPYSGFIQPEYTPVVGDNGEIKDVKVSYPTDFAKQMMKYGKDYSFLPNVN
ncbi:dipeptidyl-peptidase 3 family protein [Fulvitalea axinellae]